MIFRIHLLYIKYTYTAYYKTHQSDITGRNVFINFSKKSGVQLKSFAVLEIHPVNMLLEFDQKRCLWGLVLG